MKSFCHLNGGDQTPYINLSKKRIKGLCTILEINKTDAEPIHGLVRNTAGITISVSGYLRMERGDNVEILGEMYRVHDYTANIDPGQSGIRKDYGNFTGGTIVFLEG